MRNFTLEYWIDDGWFVGRLREVPGVFSQGATLGELESNIRDAYRLLRKDEPAAPARRVRTKEIGSGNGEPGIRRTGEAVLRLSPVPRISGSPVRLRTQPAP